MFQLTKQRMTALEEYGPMRLHDSQVQDIKRLLQLNPGSAQGSVIVSSDESDSEENTGRKIFTKKQLPRSTQLRAILDSLDRYHLKKKQVGPGQYPRVQGIQESERDLSSLPLWMQADRFHPL